MNGAANEIEKPVAVDVAYGRPTNHSQPVVRRRAVDADARSPVMEVRQMDDSRKLAVRKRGWQR